MTYQEIFILGWNLNLMMFFLNFFLAIKTMTSRSKEELYEENKVLTSLKDEFDKYYPYRKYETIATYLLPFTAFFRMSYRFLEMFSFFKKNQGCTTVDYMVYKYQSDIELAKNKLK